MKINFYIPKDETIPTDLRLKVNYRYDVLYKKVGSTLGYEFTFCKLQGVTNEMARAIMDGIVSLMIDQSYDHGSQWREDETREFEEDEFAITVKVHFRVRDAG